MKGDFTRVTFDAANHFSRVLQQQGRVTIDADPNEQASILLHYVRTLARDLIGPYGGPVDVLGFQLALDKTTKPATLSIGAGRYYVDGFLCENEAPCSYTEQPDYPLPTNDALLAQLAEPTDRAFWLYLDVWERHITAVENDHIREVALGGADTCTRAKVVWQVKAMARPSPAPSDGAGPGDDACTAPLIDLVTSSDARLAAELDPGPAIKDPCLVAPDARYRGAQNQLYRVEIHRGGTAGGSTGATFKWSRDNGSVVSAWLGTEGNDLIVASSRGFSAGVWAELTDDTLELRGEPGVLVKVVNVDGNRLSIASGNVSSVSPVWTSTLRNPKVRRWDQSENEAITLNDGAIPIREATAEDPAWFDLEDGVRVRFAVDGVGPDKYRTGDYWLIPARVVTGDIEWPHNEVGVGEFLPPHGIEHHYAPLGWLSWSSEGLSVETCLCTMQALTPCARPAIEPPVPLPRDPVPLPNPAPSRAEAANVKTRGRKSK